jgi:hypothetical protein
VYRIYSFEDLLCSLQTVSKKFPTIKIKPMRNLQNIVLHPFHLVNVMQRRHHFGPNAQQNNDQALSDPSSKPEVQEALKWLAQKCDWKPILAWDSMMCDVFPANLEPNRTFLPKADVLARIQTMVSTLRSLNIPIRISIGDRQNTCPSSGLDGSLYFGDYKTFRGEGENKHEVLLPTQAIFNLTPIASMIDELSITYPVDVPGVSGWMRPSKRPTPAENALMKREMVGWRRFWTRYASQFKNLKKLTANIPNDIYEDWGKGELPALLSDERWQMLEVEDKNPGDYGLLGSYFPFNTSSYRFAKRRSRTKFVQRVFFRLDDEPLDLEVRDPGLTEKEREEREISKDMIKDKEVIAEHRFWTKKEEDAKEDEKAAGEKRKRSEAGEGSVDGEELEVKRQKVERGIHASVFDRL